MEDTLGLPTGTKHSTRFGIYQRQMIKKSAYNALTETGDFPGLTKCTRIADALTAMSEWEENNSDNCVLAMDDGQFEGFANVARGGLQRFVSFVFIPAVRDASIDAVDSKKAVIGQLLELYVRTILQAKKGK